MQQPPEDTVGPTLAEQGALQRARREAKAVCYSPTSSPAEMRSAGEFERRLKIVLAAQRGTSVRAIAENLGCAKSLVSRVLQAYEAGGRTPAALRPRRRGRKPAPVYAHPARAILAELYAEFGTSIPPIRYRDKLNSRLTKPLHLSTVRRYLRAAGARFRKSGK